MEKSTWYLTTSLAAEKLGISKRRVQAMIQQPCPQCQGSGEESNGLKKCHRCQGTGMKLPARRFGESINSPMMIYEWGLSLPDILERKPGKPVSIKK